MSRFVCASSFRDLVDLAVKRRAADVESAGDFAHATSVMVEREIDNIAFNFMEPTNIPIFSRDIQLPRQIAFAFDLS